ncbi:unnamed protein product [Urochloa decumbens]|uniref:KIB1-4 beta-propeller domain-containing protein n=1 Tax=Urochloa decumbens TaxID=240449 RepID=A0ABC8WGI8_9POAL
MAEKLPTHLVWEISARLPCEVDRLHMALVCRAWRSYLAQRDAPPLLRRLPWLVFPFEAGASFCCVPCGSTHAVMTAPEEERGARFFGSHEGRWLMLATNRISNNVVTNVGSGVSFPLPAMSIDSRGTTHFNMYIHAASLSCSPDEPDCVGGAIVQYYPDLHDLWRIVFFIVGIGGEPAVDPLPEAFNEEPEDIAHVHSFRLISSVTGGTHLDWHLYYFPPDGRFYDEYVYGRYLVPSRGELLMVVKLSPHFDTNYGVTSGFRAFRMVRGQNLEEVARVTQCGWEELPDLDGRIIFLGRGCSRSYEAAAFPGSEEGIYFADDRGFHEAYRIEHNLTFPCSDNGRCIGMPHPEIDRCFPMHQVSSSYSSGVASAVRYADCRFLLVMTLPQFD